MFQNVNKHWRSQLERPLEETIQSNWGPSGVHWGSIGGPLGVLQRSNRGPLGVHVNEAIACSQVGSPMLVYILEHLRL
jgi:hypothetical protein